VEEENERVQNMLLKKIKHNNFTASMPVCHKDQFVTCLCGKTQMPKKYVKPGEILVCDLCLEDQLIEHFLYYLFDVEI